MLCKFHMQFHNLKQPIKSQTCESSDSHVVPECDLTQGDQSVMEALQLLGDPLKHELLCPDNQMTGSFVSECAFNRSKKELSDKEISVTKKGLESAPTPLSY